MRRAAYPALAVLGVLVAAWHAPLFLAGIYANPWPHITFLITTTVLYTLLHFGTRGSVLLAMVFHTGWNLAPEIVLYSAFAGPEWQRALTLYIVGGTVVALLATALAWRRLSASSVGNRPFEVRGAQAITPSIVDP